MMENSQSTCYTNVLLCEENLASLEQEEEGMKELGSIVDGDYDNEYIQMLLDRETRNGGLQMRDFLLTSWIRGARLDGIQYILRTRKRLGFGVQTAYASVAYLDRFLSRKSVDAEKSWAVRLLSMACISLAAKMEEITVPALSEFCAEDYNFENSVIQRMELLVLYTLEWKMGSISPFPFIQFFADKFYDDSPRNGVSRIVDVILGALRDMKIMCYRPSVVAAAATLVALNRGFTRDALQLKLSPLASIGSFAIEDIISCYYQLREMDIERLKLSRGIKSPDLSSIQLQRSEPNGSSSVTSASSAKRKRLAFNQNDENGDAPDKKESHENFYKASSV